MLALRGGHRRPTKLLAQLAAWQHDGPITGVYWLPALDDDGDLADYDRARWHEALRRRVKPLVRHHALAVRDQSRSS